MHGGLSHEQNVRLSVRRTPFVCPSVKRVNCDKTKETSAKILKPQKGQSFQFCDKKYNWSVATLEFLH